MELSKEMQGYINELAFWEERLEHWSERVDFWKYAIVQDDTDVNMEGWQEAAEGLRNAIGQVRYYKWVLQGVRINGQS